MKSWWRAAALIGLAVAPLVGLAGCLPQSDDVSLVRARNAMAQDRADWARTYFAEDRRRHPDHLESLLGEAVAWSAGYQRSRARTRELLWQYLEERPRDQEALVRYINELLVVRDLPEAESRLEFLDRSVQSDFLRARVEAPDRPDRALELANSVLDRAPEMAGAWALKAELEEQLGHHALSISSAQKALALDPFRYSTVYLVARQYRRMGEIQAADDALEMHKIVAALQADGTRKEVSVAEELELLERLRPFIDAEAGVFRARLVAALFRAGRVTEAIHEAEREIDERVHGISELASLAVLADQAGARALARRLFEEILDRQPDHVGAQASLVLLDLEAGRLDRAGSRLAGAQAAHPDFARLVYLQGRLALVQGDADGAAEAFERALLMAPWEWQWRAALAELYLARGDRKALKRIIDEAPETPPGWQALRARYQKTLDEK